MKRRLTDAEINHLRRLLGWVRCEIGQSPEDLVETVRGIVLVTGTPSAEAKDRLVESHRKAERAPKYVRAAVKALSKTIEPDGEIVVPAEDRNVLKASAQGGE